MDSLRQHEKERFWSGADKRQQSATRTNLKVWTAGVEEIGAGADAGKVKVRLPGEVTPLADLPFAPVDGPTPAVGDQVTVLADAASRRVMTGGDNLLSASAALESPATGATLEAAHYYNVSAAGASLTLPSGDVDPSTTTEATKIIVIRCIVDCTINAAGSQTINGSLASFAMPAFSSVILAARGTSGWAVLASSGVPAFTPTVGRKGGKKSADQSFTSTTFSDVTDMTFTYGPGEAWEFEFNIYYRADATDDIKMFPSTSGAANLFYTAFGLDTATTAAPGALQHRQIAYFSSVALTFAGLGTANSNTALAVVKGLVIGDVSGGSITMRAAKNAATSANNAVISLFSNFVAHKVG